MHNPTNAPCPRCARTHTEIVSRREVYQRIAGHGPRSEQPHYTIYTLRCACGAVFTYDVKQDNAKA